VRAQNQQKSFDARLIDTGLIDEPDNAARSTLDETRLQDLILSIQAVGLIEPLVVVPTGRRFRVLAGHRRLIACRALKLKQVPCIVRAPGEISGEAVTVHENAYREDLNAAEEARYFGQLLKSQCEGDVDKLCTLTRQTRNYVESRLLLLAGDARVLEALAGNVISMGVAQELNRFQDGARRLVYLDAAIQGGATVRTVKDWRRMDDGLAPAFPVNLEDQPAAGVAIQRPVQLTLFCLICEGTEDVHDMELFYVHRYCRKAVLDRILGNLKGGDDGVKQNGST